MMKIGDVESFVSHGRDGKKRAKRVTGTVVKVNAKTFWLDIGNKWVKRRMKKSG